MSIEHLTRLVAPPARGADSGSGEQWEECERRLGFSLPSDYRQLIQVYGTGCWLNFLWVLSPFAGNVHLNLHEKAARLIEAEGTIRSWFPEEVPFPLYPEPEGLFPWAVTDNGDRLYWHRCGEPDGWATVIFESRGPHVDRHPLACTEFLARWVSGELAVSVFPDDLEFGRGDAFTSTMK